MRSLDREERRAAERDRIRAVKQVRAGRSVKDVAEILGYEKSTVYRWLRWYDQGGFEALKESKAPGKPPLLSLKQMARLRAVVIGSDPRQLRFEFALWTREMIGELIEREFGVTMSVSAVGRLLRRLGMSPQRPLWRAYQADPVAVEMWRTTTYPQIRAEAERLGAVIYFQDEASVRSDYHGGTTWGEVGCTPVVTSTGARYSVNMLSAISPQGKLHFMIAEGRVNADAFIGYCERLLDDNPGRPVFLIVDGHPAHRAKKTKQWVESTNGRLRLFFLPGYSPQLNPDEWVWKNVKHDRIGKAGVSSLEDLRHKVVAALERLARAPQILLGIFRDPNLRYIGV